MGAMTTARNYASRPLRWHEWRDVERGEMILFHCMVITMSPNFPKNPDEFVVSLYEDNRLAKRAMAYERKILKGIREPNAFERKRSVGCEYTR